MHLLQAILSKKHCHLLLSFHSEIEYITQRLVFGPASHHCCSQRRLLSPRYYPSPVFSQDIIVSNSLLRDSERHTLDACLLFYLEMCLFSFLSYYTHSCLFFSSKHLFISRVLIIYTRLPRLINTLEVYGVLLARANRTQVLSLNLIESQVACQIGLVNLKLLTNMSCNIVLKDQNICVYIMHVIFSCLDVLNKLAI